MRPARILANTTQFPHKRLCGILLLQAAPCKTQSSGSHTQSTLNCHPAAEPSHSVDRGGWQAKMASIEFWIQRCNAHRPQCTHIWLHLCMMSAETHLRYARQVFAVSGQGLIDDRLHILVEGVNLCRTHRDNGPSA